MRLGEILGNEIQDNEVAIFLFEIGDSSAIQRSVDIVKEKGCILMNSLRFNEVDWSIVVKKSSEIPLKDANEATLELGNE